MKNKHSGFTLIEIAIVLVIIGLLLGGVLKGQELITQAKIKNIANDISGISVAVYGYQDRYKRLPGDDSGAAVRWTSPLAVAGDSNGQIGLAGVKAVFDCTIEVGENCQIWQHLRLSGFIGGNAAIKSSPQNAVGGVLQIQHGALGLSGSVICSTGLLGKIAFAVDAQFDDGNPGTGLVRGTDSATALDTKLADTSAYKDDGATTYVVCKQL